MESSRSLVSRITPRHLRGSLGLFTRGKSLSRLAHDAVLIPILQGLPTGDVVDIGSKDRRYEPYLPADCRLKSLDIQTGPGIDYVCDAHDIKLIGDETFDAVLGIQVLEHCHTPERVVSEIHRILRRGGVGIISVPFIYVIHSDPQDFYRYAEDGLRHLFSRFSNVTVTPYGNALQASVQLLASRYPPFQVLFPLLVHLPAERLCPLGYVVTARK